MNGFLHSFDLAYPLRRLVFIQNRIDRLHRLDQHVPVLIDRLYRLKQEAWPYPRVFQKHVCVTLTFQNDLEQGVLSDAFRLALESQGIRLSDNYAITTTVPTERWCIEDDEIYFVSKEDALHIYYSPVQAAFTRDFRKELLKVKRKLNRIYAELHEIDYALRSPAKLDTKNIVSASHIHQLIGQLIQAINARVRERSTLSPDQQQTNKKDSPLLGYFLGVSLQPAPASEGQLAAARQPSWAEADCDERAQRFLAQNKDIRQLFNQLGQALASQLKPMMEAADTQCRDVLALNSTEHGSGAYAARLSLLYYYQNYPAYDGIIFPILYGTDAGEADTVEILRISPEDADALIDEQATGCQKLAGTSFSHFGAFLQERWRKNDILWGRLDGAERIIHALVPHHPQVRQLIGEAQAAIVCETIQKMGIDERNSLLSEAFMRTKSGKADATMLTDFIQKLKENAYRPELKQKLDQEINEQILRDDYINKFKVRKQLDSEQALKTTARATTVIGEMLRGISAQYNLTNKYVLWMARIGRLLWGLVEVAVPRSLPSLLFHYWLGLGYLFEIVLMVGSIFLVNSQVQHFALTLFAFTVATHLAVLILSDVMRDRSTWLHIIKIVTAILGIVFVLWGVIFLLAVTGIVDSWWSLVLMLRGWFAG